MSRSGVYSQYIDENEHANSSHLLDLMFGKANRVGDIVWKNSSKNNQNYVSMQHEYLLGAVIDKNANSGEWAERKLGLDKIYTAFNSFSKQYGNDWIAIHSEALKWYGQFPDSDPIKDNKHYSWMDENGVYFPADLSGPNFGQYRYDLFHPITKKVCKEPASGWRYPESTMLQRVKNNQIHFGIDETTIPNNRKHT